ncbi:hypothetical protein AVEN_149726-1 [Araneus ventricosus]|uniref:Uncharacterized protein n=1 Tax=Araneus ventricosus TaxID=182803 RepID=A0A4Y2VJR3_ARAVE|nr:hypothetical protein AVEN_149726-1 [Araneus ventricosus]
MEEKILSVTLLFELQRHRNILKPGQKKKILSDTLLSGARDTGTFSSPSTKDTDATSSALSRRDTEHSQACRLEYERRASVRATETPEHSQSLEEKMILSVTLLFEP